MEGNGKEKEEESGESEENIWGGHGCGLSELSKLF